MNKVSKALVMILIVLFCGISMSIKFREDYKALSVKGITFLKQSPDGNLNILVDQNILVFSPENEFIRSIALGYEDSRTFGDFDFFSNGDLLYYSTEEEKSFLKTLEIVFRLQDKESKPSSYSAGLIRCNSAGKDCRLFSESSTNFSSAFRLYIDTNQDNVYLADTGRFELLKYNREGKLLAKSTERLKFPNQILFSEEKLYVANTNYNEISVLDGSTENYGHLLESYAATINSNHKWPAHFVRTPSNWWVLVSDSEMAKARVIIFNKEWEKINTIKISNTADPIGIIYYQGLVWITDYSSSNIYLFEEDGNRLPDFKHGKIEEIKQTIASKVSTHKAQSNLAFGVFFGTLVIGFVLAWLLERNETKDYLDKVMGKEKEVLDLKPTPAHEGEIFWLYSKLSKNGNIILYLFIAFIVLMLGISIWNLIELGLSDFLFPFVTLSLIPMAFLIYWFITKISKIRIGINGDYLYIDNGEEEPVYAKGSEIRASGDYAFVIKDQIALLGKDGAFFNKQEVDDWIRPLLKNSTMLSELDYWKIIWKNKHPLLYLLGGVIAYVGFLFLFLEIYQLIAQ